MEPEKMIAFCGDVCSECPRYLATKSNHVAQLEYLADLWFRLGFRDTIVKPEDLKCTGCSLQQDCNYKINACENLKNKSNCGECDLFPCAKINYVFEKAEYYKDKCKEKCTDEEFKILNRAFFLKKEILNEINQKYKSTN